MINNTKSRASKEEVRQHLQNKGERNIVGGASGLEFIGGAGVKAVKGAFNIIKNLLKKRQVPHGASKYASKRGQRRPDGTRI
jgi:hypothetical protein|tara:strand:- start:438 stop:683 length:246 start_codon:yes stop_codon:yes gene_type:complete